MGHPALKQSSKARGVVMERPHDEVKSKSPLLAKDARNGAPGLETKL
jgi:hypothetical protein